MINQMNICSCPLCSKGCYNPKDYIVDTTSFKRERPNGVTGLMRVKNEACWIEASIDSCIDALDELIICYQKCDDDTPAIIKRKQLEYPDKIKVYYYAPYVYAHNLSREDFVYACSLPEDSIHLLSNYYNYTLSKATYRYALKIDADQIYFTSRLRELCDAYRSDVNQRITLSEKLVFLYSKIYKSLYIRFPQIWKFLFNFFPSGNYIYEKYWLYLIHQISQTKQPVALSGINLYRKNRSWWVFGLEKNDFVFPYYFNGGGDHIFFPVSNESYYKPVYQSPFIEDVSNKIVCNSFFLQYRIIERFVFPVNRFEFIGLMWYHMKFCMEKGFVQDSRIRATMEFNAFIRSSCKKLNNYNLWPMDKIDQNWAFFYMNDKSFPMPDDFLQIKDV